MNTQINEDYVSFEVAKLLKEKGFKGECLGVYFPSSRFDTFDTAFDYNLNDGNLSHAINAPTLQMVMKWLRKIYSLEIYPYHDFPKVGDKWWFEIIKYPNSVSEYESETAYNSYEEAVEEAIKYCLINLI